MILEINIQQDVTYDVTISFVIVRGIRKLQRTIKLHSPTNTFYLINLNAISFRLRRKRNIKFDGFLSLICFQNVTVCDKDWRE